MTFPPALGQACTYVGHLHGVTIDGDRALWKLRQPTASGPADVRLKSTIPAVVAEIKAAPEGALIGVVAKPDSLSAPAEARIVTRMVVLSRPVEDAKR
jgi:hypothetical protein